MTGQYPRRRETDRQARERVAALEERASRLLAPIYVPPGRVALLNRAMRRAAR